MSCFFECCRYGSKNQSSHTKVRPNSEINKTAPVELIVKNSEEFSRKGSESPSKMNRFSIAKNTRAPAKSEDSANSRTKETVTGILSPFSRKNSFDTLDESATPAQAQTGKLLTSEVSLQKKAAAQSSYRESQEDEPKDKLTPPQEPQPTTLE